MGTKVVVVGGTGALGEAVVAAASADAAVDEVRVFDVAPATPELLADALEGTGCLVYLGTTASGPGLDGTGVVPDVDDLRTWLPAARRAGVDQLVVLSSALVYGAWPDNPVPITEQAVLRPDPALELAGAKAELEHLAGDWREDGTAVALLRPVVTVSEATADWFARSPWAGSWVPKGEQPPPTQVLHLDDLASAVDHARRARLDGAANVAPDGWMAPDELVALAAPWRPGRTRPPAVLARYLTHPWVVANDRLRTTGWTPAHSAAEAYVVADDGGPLAALSAKRRQQLSLGASGGALAALVAAVWLLVRRRRRGAGTASN
jgi:nucleoside-diphosphate-sugar epimerase